MKKNIALCLSIAILWAQGPLPAVAAQFQRQPGVSTHALPGLQRPAAAIPGLPQSALPQAAGAKIGAQALPGASASGAAAALPEARTAEPQTLMGRLETAVAEKTSGETVFDAAATRPSASLASAVGLLPMNSPAASLPGLDFGTAPTAHPTSRPAVLVTPDQFGLPDLSRPDPIGLMTPLSANADSEADVERALRAHIDAQAARFGVDSTQLKTVHVRRIAGRGDQADTIYALFHHQLASRNPDGTVLPVVIDGSQLSFVVKVLNGKPYVMPPLDRLARGVNVKTDTLWSEDELKDRASQKLPQIAGLELVLLERRVIHHRGKWKTVNLYDLDGLPRTTGVKIAVDVATGQVFGWDGRHGVTAAAPAGKASGVAQARAEAHEARPNKKPVLSDMPLPHLEAKIDGKDALTDADGKFAADVAGAGASFEAGLEGRWVRVFDENGKPVKIKAKVQPGTGNVVMADAKEDDLTTINQLNMYVWITKIHDWWSSRLGNDKRIDRQLPVNTNIDDECNAYYTPGRPSLNFFKESRNNGECSDTGRPGIGAHEYGHFVDDMLGGIIDGGLSEGWGDIGSMFLLGSPVIGDGFLRHRNPSYIRHGENLYQYSQHDEVHDQGQAWMGFAWKLRAQLVKALGEAAGAAEAEALIVPTLLAKATDIPTQMAQVLLNGMDKTGKIKYEREIRAAAKAHGIDLPAAPQGLGSSLWAKTTNLFGYGDLSISRDEGLVTPEGVDLAEAIPGTGGRRIVIKGATADVERLRARVAAAYQYRRGEDAQVELTATLTPGWLGKSELLVMLTGDAEVAGRMAEQVRRLAGQAASLGTEPRRSRPLGPMAAVRPQLKPQRATLARVISDEAEWKALWGDDEAPAVDFAKDQVVHVFAGSRSTGGWKVEFDAPVLENGELVVRYNVRGPQGMATQAITNVSGYTVVPKGAPVRVEEKKTPTIPLGSLRPMRSPGGRQAGFVSVKAGATIALASVSLAALGLLVPVIAPIAFALVGTTGGALSGTAVGAKLAELLKLGREKMPGIVTVAASAVVLAALGGWGGYLLGSIAHVGASAAAYLLGGLLGLVGLAAGGGLGLLIGANLTGNYESKPSIAITFTLALIGAALGGWVGYHVVL